MGRHHLLLPWRVLPAAHFVLLLQLTVMLCSLVVQTHAFASSSESAPLLAGRTKRSLEIRHPLFNTRRFFASGSSGDNGRDEEIARLEEQLRLLKQEQAQEEQEESVVNAPKETKPRPVSKINESGKPQSLPSGKGEGFFFTEGHLADRGILQDDDKSADSNGWIPTAALAVAALVFLAFFSQVPIGQEDLSRYSVTPASSSSSSSRIDLGDLNEVKSVVGP